ncbi:MAG: BatD family protein [Bacteroidota bacterium]
MLLTTRYMAVKQFAFMLLLVGTMQAQDITFQASVDKNPVGMGDQFTLLLTLNNATGGGKNLRLPDLSKFHVMGGPNQSSSMQIINGAISSSITYSYILQPKEMGKITIGAVAIEAGGNIYRTQPVVVEVVKGTPKPKQQAGVSDDVSAQIADNLFLRAAVDRSQVMQGEQINLTFKLYTRVSVANYAVNKNPALTGFWGEDIENPKNVSLTNETIDGKQYRVGIIRRMALFPTQSGTLEISPMEVQTTVQIQSRRSNDPFDAFFRDPFGQTVNYMAKSDPVKVRVLPLPPGAPPSFKGAVGRFSMSTTLDKQATKTNEPISLKVTIQGSGNIKLLESPIVDLPVDFEQYTPKVSENINRRQERISGSKVFEYILIPRYPGQKSIKPVTFSFYDLGKKEYVSLSSSPLDLKVEPGAAGVAPYVAGGSREDVQMLSQDIRFIKVSDGGLAKRGQFLHTSGVFFAMLLLPVAGFAGALFVSRNRQSMMSDEAGYRNRRAIKVAQKGLKQADELLKGKNGGEKNLQFYSEAARAMWKYLGDKLNIPPAEMSIDKVLGVLSVRSVNDQLSDNLKSLLETCEMARFTPTSTDPGEMQKTYDSAKRIIVELERTLKS